MNGEKESYKKNQVKILYATVPNSQFFQRSMEEGKYVYIAVLHKNKGAIKEGFWRQRNVFVSQD